MQLTTKQMECKDEFRILATMLNDAEVKIDKLTEVGTYMVKVSTKHFAMTLRKNVAVCPLNVLQQGVRTWSMRLTNSNGRQVMYASSMHPSVSSHMGDLISKHEDANEVDHRADDWSELEAYAGLK